MTGLDIIIRKMSKKININKIVILTHKLMEVEYGKVQYFDVLKDLKYDSKQYLFLKKKIEGLYNSILLIAEKSQMLVMNRMLWECDNVKGILYLDTDNPYEIEEVVTKKERLLWDVQANISENQAIMSGWRNSYNNHEFSEADLQEYIENSKQKLSPYIEKETKMLEVGIGSGMIAYQLAPLCKKYDGCDISNLVLQKLNVMCKKKNQTNISLYNLAADEIDQINETYNIILMSSVTEYFSGYNYMRKVVEKCIKSIEETGVVFFADVFDLAKKEQYRESVYSYAKKNPGCRYKRDFSHELFIPREFWMDIEKSFNQIQKVVISEKIGEINNEINTFRYDVLFEIDKKNPKEIEDINLNKYQFGCFSDSNLWTL